MRKSIFLHGFLAVCVMITSFSACLEQRGVKYAMNPDIWADVPDNAIMRVWDTYYMSSTTMHMNPGLPIMKSKDLANWEMLNYAY